MIGPMIMGRQALLGMVTEFMGADEPSFNMAISICRPIHNGDNPIIVTIRLSGAIYGFTIQQLGQAIGVIDAARASQTLNYGEAEQLGQLLAVLREAYANGSSISSHGLH